MDGVERLFAIRSTSSSRVVWLGGHSLIENARPSGFIVVVSIAMELPIWALFFSEIFSRVVGVL